MWEVSKGLLKFTGRLAFFTAQFGAVAALGMFYGFSQSELTFVTVLGLLALVAGGGLVWLFLEAAWIKPAQRAARELKKAARPRRRR
ncbi:MAG: hypothetical protein OXN21_02200 [Chloroflexota bacterium]|nr:hypothetical protein [Chloroflexota bacterium]